MCSGHMQFRRIPIDSSITCIRPCPVLCTAALAMDAAECIATASGSSSGSSSSAAVAAGWVRLPLACGLVAGLRPAVLAPQSTQVGTRPDRTRPIRNMPAAHMSHQAVKGFAGSLPPTLTGVVLFRGHQYTCCRFRFPFFFTRHAFIGCASRLCSPAPQALADSLLRLLAAAPGAATPPLPEHTACAACVALGAAVNRWQVGSRATVACFCVFVSLAAFDVRGACVRGPVFMQPGAVSHGCVLRGNLMRDRCVKSCTCIPTPHVCHNAPPCVPTGRGSPGRLGCRLLPTRSPGTATRQQQ